MRRFIFMILLFATSPAVAATWMVDQEKSTLRFKGEQAGEKFTGGFKKFTSEIDFDTAHPEHGKIHVVVDMTSAFADTKDRTESLPTADWLNVKQFTTAEFTSTKIAHVGRDTNTFTAQGNLTLRGVTKPLELSFTLEPKDALTHATGKTILNRNDFGVGQGEWKNDEWIKYPVTVSFDLYAHVK